MPLPPKLPTERETELHEAVHEAVLELRCIRAEYQRLMQIGKDLGSTPDGLQAVRQAARMQTEALRRLKAALTEFETTVAPLYEPRPKT